MRYTIKSYLDADWRRLSEVAGRDRLPRKWKSCFSPRFAPVALIRISQVFHEKGWLVPAKFFSLVNFLVFNIEVPASLQIGPGLVIPHPQGTVLGAREIGENVTIFHQVTLGGKVADFSYDLSQRPKICDGATLSVGAKILGPYTVGVGAVVGANAVVVSDVPDNTTVVGVPAKAISK